MKYGIFDSRPKHNEKPYVFHHEDGRRVPAVYDNKEMAERMAIRMNALTSLTTFVVKEVC